MCLGQKTEGRVWIWSNSPQRRVIPHPPPTTLPARGSPPGVQGTSNEGKFVKDERKIEITKPRQRLLSSSISIPETPKYTIHAWTDGSFRESAGAGWLVTRDADGRVPALVRGMKVLGTEQTPFDAEVTAVEAVVRWMVQRVVSNPDLEFRHMVAHSDSTMLSLECDILEMALARGCQFVLICSRSCT
jgi:hypothetical protein